MARPDVPPSDAGKWGIRSGAGSPVPRSRRFHRPGQPIASFLCPLPVVVGQAFQPDPVRSDPTRVRLESLTYPGLPRPVSANNGRRAKDNGPLTDYDNRPSIAFRQSSLGESVVPTIKTRRCSASLLLMTILACAGCGDATTDGSGSPSGSSGTGGAASSGGPGSGPRLMFITNGSSDWW